MKRKIFLVMILSALVLSGCGKSELEVVEKENVVEQQGEKKNESYSLFQDADEFYEVPIGDVINDEYTKVCKVKLPQNYIISGSEIEGVDDNTFNGAMLSEHVKNNDFETSSLYSIVIGNDNMQMNINVKKTQNDETILEHDRNWVQDGVELKLNKYQAYGLELPDSGVSMYKFRTTVQLNDDVGIWINYGGPLFGKISNEELAQYLYDIVIPVE